MIELAAELPHASINTVFFQNPMHRMPHGFAQCAVDKEMGDLGRFVLHVDFRFDRVVISITVAQPAR